jgi:hypothetical protein
MISKRCFKKKTSDKKHKEALNYQLMQRFHLHRNLFRLFRQIVDISSFQFQSENSQKKAM